MKKRRRVDNRSLSFLEYAVFIGAVVAALIAMTFMLRQKTESSLKANADAISEGRQFGALATYGGGPRFTFPTLPGLPNSSGENPPGIEPECDVEAIKALADAAEAKRAIANRLTENAAEARKSVIEAQKILANAQLAFKIARDEAIFARQLAREARQAADEAQAQCDECTAEGETDCTSICDEAQVLADEATAKEEAAAEKERIARLKELDMIAAQQEVDRLEPFALQLEADRDAAEQEAAEAARALEEAQSRCFS